MFRPTQDSDQTRIKLPRRTLPPTIDYLQFAFVQAFQYREKEVEITWTDYSSTILFILVVRAESEKDIPLWTLWQESSNGSEFLWSSETSELEVVQDQILTVDPMNRDLAINDPKPTSQDSPFRQMFSQSYHGIKAQSQNSIRDTFTRLRPASSNRSDYSVTSANSPIVTSNRQVINYEPPLFSQAQTQQPPQQASEVEPSQQKVISEQAASIMICQTILAALTKLNGDGNSLSVHATAENIVSGTLEQTNIQNKHLINIIAANQLSGKLELINQSSGTGLLFFDHGVLYSASVVIFDEQLSKAGLVNGAGEIQGDQALLETVIWSPSSFKFFIDEKAADKNVSGELHNLVSEASSIRDDLSHLERAGLKERSIIIKKQDNLGENELRLLLGKHSDADVNEQIELYKCLPKKFTAADIFKDGPISKVTWVPIIYRFFANGLIEIKPPLATNESALDFMEEGKKAVQALKASFIRQESGIFSYPALLYFLQYEYLRFQSYETPLSLIVFEMSKVSTNALGGLDLINKQESLVALNRINAMKRPLDFLGHFETINYALLLPNTTTHTASQMASHIVRVLTAQPLSAALDPSLLRLSFGIGSIPYDCKDVEELIVLSKRALLQSKNGNFLIVQAGGIK